MNGLIIFKNAGLGGIERSFLKFFSSSFYHESQVLAQPGDELDARYQVSQTEDKEFIVNTATTYGRASSAAQPALLTHPPNGATAGQTGERLKPWL